MADWSLPILKSTFVGNRLTPRARTASRGASTAAHTWARSTSVHQPAARCLGARRSRRPRCARARGLRGLHQQARRALRDQPDGHTLQPTALVNEAYVRLANQPGAGAESRSHFLAVAAMVMRSVLVDHARARQRAKRGGNARAVSLGAADGVASPKTPWTSSRSTKR